MGFSEDLRKVHEPRYHKMKNSYGLRDYYRYYKKVSHTKLDELTYNNIVRDIFTSLIENELVNMLPICLPNKLGFIEVDIVKPKVVCENGEYRYIGPVDWKKTISLWEKDGVAKENKTLVYTTAVKTSVVNYVKRVGSFKNQLYYYLRPARKLKEYIHKVLFNNDLFNF